MKTYKGWHESNAKTIDEYLIIGDEVDEEMIDYFRDILPPKTSNMFMLQVGEPCDHVNGKATYITFVKQNSKWIYRGECFKGESGIDGRNI